MASIELGVEARPCKWKGCSAAKQMSPQALQSILRKQLSTLGPCPVRKTIMLGPPGATLMYVRE